MSMILDGSLGLTTPGVVNTAGETIATTLAVTGASTCTGTGKFATTIGVGNATPSASGSGITFPATQSASTDANTLDDYEEGTWTPSIGGTATYGGARYGRYVKIGKMVTVQFLISISLKGTGSASILSGLPFTSEAVGTVQSGAVSYYGVLAVNTIFIALYIENNATTMQFVGKAVSGATVDNAIGLFGNSTEVYGWATYMTA